MQMCRSPMLVPVSSAVITEREKSLCHKAWVKKALDRRMAFWLLQHVAKAGDIVQVLEEPAGEVTLQAASLAAPTVPEYMTCRPKLSPRLIPDTTKSNPET